MIVVDTSAIVTIIKSEPGHERYERALAMGPVTVGAPSMLEIKLALSSVLAPADADRLVDKLARGADLTLSAFTPEMANVAVAAFRRFGKGQGHPAQLNFGDCMSYAVARVFRAPLLFKGEDFFHTDVEPALSA